MRPRPRFGDWGFRGATMSGTNFPAWALFWDLSPNASGALRGRSLMAPQPCVSEAALLAASAVQFLLPKTDSVRTFVLNSHVGPCQKRPLPTRGTSVGVEALVFTTV